MFTLYFHTSPNPMKVALMLEELGTGYEVAPVDTRRGEQHSPDYLAINPNGKTPALRDGAVTVFDSNAILLYLSEKTGRFGGPAEARSELLSWLMFVATGVGPFGGQAFHFKHVAPQNDYATNRYVREFQRHLEVLDYRLSDREYIVGGEYTIVDMAAWGWIRLTDFVLDEGSLARFTNLQAWFDQVEQRSAVQRAKALETQFKFKQEMDEESLRALFPQNYAGQAA
ncbi:glutathione S-transferase family protein [Phenylobacterium sp.]|uniref:glutathione S-transferase family protein n=1 Tax=Phenylobacterium sp. TaxID=1871053 RepID=UPI0035B07F46